MAETIENEVTDRLKGLQTGLPPEEKAGPEGAAPGAPDIPAEDMAKIVLKYIDTACKNSGLTPINEMQRFILTVGLVGTIRKYNISMSLVERYPETALVVGGSWIAMDKVKEYNAKKKTEPTEGGAAAAPGVAGQEAVSH